MLWGSAVPRCQSKRTAGCGVPEAATKPTVPGLSGEEHTSGDIDLSRRSIRYLYCVCHAAVRNTAMVNSGHGRWALRQCAA